MTINSICIQLGAADEVKLKLLNAKPATKLDWALFSQFRKSREEGRIFSPIYDGASELGQLGSKSGNDAGCGGVGNEIGGRGEQMNRH